MLHSSSGPDHPPSQQAFVPPEGAQTARTDDFLAGLRAIVGRRHVLTHPSQTRRFRTGYRFGGGRVLAVIRPGNLVEQWLVLQACVQAGRIVIMQAANTGLTGGSTPDGDQYDRDVGISARSVPDCAVTEYVARTCCPESTGTIP
jgi:D-lactate dehydrogenase (quinone)